MTAAEWLAETFPNVGDGFMAADSGEFEKYGITANIPNTFPIIGNTQLFLAWFGPAIDSALDSGASIYAALTDPSVPQRGWTPIFQLWKAKGLIS